MLRLTLAAAVATLASPTLARPVYDQILPMANAGIASQDAGLFGFDKRAADDFFLNGITNSDHLVTGIQVVMIGNAAPIAGRFAVTIRSTSVSNGILVPGPLVKTVIGARSVVFGGSTGVPGMNKYIVTFQPTGPNTIILRNNVRYWISPFALSSQAGSWSFARRIGAVRNQPARRQIEPISTWLPFTPSTDCAFVISTIQ